MWDDAIGNNLEILEIHIHDNYLTIRKGSWQGFENDYTNYDSQYVCFVTQVFMIIFHLEIRIKRIIKMQILMTLYKLRKRLSAVHRTTTDPRFIHRIIQIIQSLVLMIVVGFTIVKHNIEAVRKIAFFLYTRNIRVQYALFLFIYHHEYF